MATTSWGRATSVPEDDLRKMVGPAPLRYGSGRWRLIEENIPIWPVIGTLYAIAGTTEPVLVTSNHLTAVAEDLGLPLRSVEAAFLHYGEHRAGIDTLLEWHVDMLGPKVDLSSDSQTL